MTGKVQYQNGRPFSTTNPFRNVTAMELDGSTEDEQFKQWAQNMHRDLARDPSFRQESPVSRRSFRSSTPPTPKHVSTNPFLDDADLERVPNTTNNVSPQRPKQYSTAREEKDRLREKYYENDDGHNDTNVNQDQPPSYDEIVPKNKDKSKYPGEKGSSRHSSRRHHNSPSQHRHEHRSSRYHSSSTSSSNRKDKEKKKTKPPKNVDTIDKLDVTGLFGGSFHHDGPFDACTPHRNKNIKAAPVLAFPVNGPNSTIGGAPTVKKFAISEVFGVHSVDDEDDAIYENKNKKKNVLRKNVGEVKQVDVKNKEVVHGPETGGLGSSTFLDGTPAVGHTLQRGKTVSYKPRPHTNSLGSAGIQRNMTINSGPSTRQRYDSAGSSNRSRMNREPSSGLDYDDEEEDIYLGVRIDPNAKKESTGNKFLRRVKSLKVGRK
ncbi:hypothetical protein KAFR_0E04090 [Kazachstania africana CBS 2517]|uniref:Pal1 cell morphology protein n=1 Tax=Kazachstania africana (strain ATCC 22294 / BCRC 22015 / CBS 2517 / CECT 1963 / NBRC 1671 / NRRL Y-8276) TaxID=1071382 RepID=H2AW10_KAZAF|nr:hypothetical protein KAFR_0E04090 [Kazachstania africana CBS 2517]CCF58560.1 hypothetical protein KAFR_0E04090 [Kazachstania africana CBS 2517]